MQKGGTVDRQLVNGSSLPSDEQRALLEYASRHPESTLHSTGRRHDVAVLLIHGIPELRRYAAALGGGDSA